jgi:hypothetical protein
MRRPAVNRRRSIGLRRGPSLIKACDGDRLSRAGYPNPPPADGDVSQREEITVDMDVISPITVPGGSLGAQRNVPTVQHGKLRGVGDGR